MNINIDDNEIGGFNYHVYKPEARMMTSHKMISPTSPYLNSEYIFTQIIHLFYLSQIKCLIL